MLSEFVKKLLFTRELFIIDGKVEILGEKQGVMPLFLYAEIQKDSKSYELFKRVAKKICDKNFERVGRRDITTAQQLFELFGFGKIEFFDLDMKEKKAIIRIEHNPFVENCIENKIRPEGNCKITAALLSGLMSSFFGKDVNANEDMCMFEGKNYCEFIIK